VGPQPLCGYARSLLPSPTDAERPTDIGARVFPAKQHPDQQLDESIGT